MTRLIDADALDALIVESYHMTDQEYVRAGYSIVRLLIDKVPTVDAVPVIRCKDCKHYYALNEVRGNCSEYNFIDKISLDYCSWAERKEK